MGTVQVLTKARMEAIEAASVVGGSVVNGDLILARQDASTFNAGSVIGPTGPQGPTGEVSQASFDLLEGRVETLEQGRGVSERSGTADYTAYTAGSGWDASKAIPFPTIVSGATENAITYNAGRFTIAQAGLYAVNLLISPKTTATGGTTPVYVNLWNATTQLRFATGKIDGTQQTEFDRLSVFGIWRFAANDEIQASAYCATGAQNLTDRNISIYQITAPGL